jgi:hypothetical protein
MFNDDISAYAPSWLFPNQIRYMKLCIFSYLYIPIVHNLVNSQTSLTVLIFHILTHTSHKLYHTLNSLKHTHALYSDTYS